MIRLRNHARIKLEAAVQVRVAVGLELHARNRFASEINRVASQAARNFVDHGDVGMTELMASHRSHLEPLLKGTYHAAASVFAARVLAQPKSAKADEGFEPDTETAISAWIRQWTGTKVKDISETTGEHIAAIVNAEENGDLTREETAQLIARKVGGVGAINRAQTIARTETHAASQFGSMAAAESLGIPNLQKIWVSTGDERTRPDHQDADGQQVAIADKFEVGGEELEFPGDPSGSAENVINCRCAQVFDDQPDDGKGFDPNEARDNQGQWTSEGGGGTAIAEMPVGTSVGTATPDQAQSAYDALEASQEAVPFEKTGMQRVPVGFQERGDGIATQMRRNDAEGARAIVRFTKQGDNEDYHTMRAIDSGRLTSGEQFDKLLASTNAVSNALAENSRAQVPTYRGILVNRETAGRILGSSTVETDSFSSSSADKTVALDFANDGEKSKIGIVFRMEKAQGINISGFSKYSESEILLGKGQRFNVTSRTRTTYKGRTIWYVTAKNAAAKTQPRGEHAASIFSKRNGAEPIFFSGNTTKL